jgi:hypothetical protein
MEGLVGRELWEGTSMVVTLHMFDEMATTIVWG